MPMASVSTTATANPGDRPNATAYMLQIHQQRFESLPLPYFTAALLE